MMYTYCIGYAVYGEGGYIIKHRHKVVVCKISPSWASSGFFQAKNSKLKSQILLTTLVETLPMSIHECWGANLRYTFRGETFNSPMVPYNENKNKNKNNKTH